MECDICCQAFDTERPPQVLTRCGHTLCSVCIENIRRTSRHIDIVCPNCRSATSPADVRTNFALLQLMQVPTETPQTGKEPACETHPLNSVTVFCSTCMKFICNDCFQVSASIHANHIRVPLQKGFELLMQEVDQVRANFKDLLIRNDEDIQRESSLVHNGTLHLHSLAQRAVDHYNHVSLRLRAELDNVLQSLQHAEGRLAADLNQYQTKKLVFEEVLAGLPVSPDVNTLRLFTQRRDRIRQFMQEQVNTAHITAEFDAFSITGRRGINRTAKDYVLPELRLLNTSEMRLFDMEPSESARSNATASSEHSDVRIHRSTSNDQLSR